MPDRTSDPRQALGSYVRLSDPPATVAARIIERVNLGAAARIADELHDLIERERWRALNARHYAPPQCTRAEAEARLAEIVHRAAAMPPPPTSAERRAARGSRR